MVSLARAASNHAVTSMIDAGTYYQIPLCHCKQAVMPFNNCYNLVSSLIQLDAKLTTVPESCPKEFDPETITRKRMQANALGRYQRPSPLSHTLGVIHLRRLLLITDLNQVQHPPLPSPVSSLFVAANCRAALLPTNTSRPYCANWLYMGKSCPRAFGKCSGCHEFFYRVNHAGNKRLIVGHVTSTPGLWFNIDNVRSLTDPTRTAQLAGPDGPTGTN